MIKYCSKNLRLSLEECNLHNVQVVIRLTKLYSKRFCKSQTPNATSQTPIYARRKLLNIHSP